jgi:ribonucleoside-diphosphate reductase alpha chain
MAIREEDQRQKLTIERRFTREGVHPYAKLEWEIRHAQTLDRDGKVIFEQENVKFPKSWSINATNIVAEKYFRGQQGTPQRERSVKQIVDRVVGSIGGWGEEQGRFEGVDRAIFEDELTHILVNQLACFNSPVWFNIGVPGRSQQASACFILHLDDSSRSISQWYHDELFIFKGGSGSGVNIGTLRSSYEQLSIGGYSSGPMPFMRGADSIAAAIKSGGATRRAAKMVVMPVSHPDLLQLRDGETGFVRCKADEEKKARVLKEAGFDMAVDSGRDKYSIQYQNANDSVRVTDDFMAAYDADEDWHLRAVTSGEVISTWKARYIMREIAQAAWECADPGMQYHDTINDWHTAPAAGPITASNPCSEYMHIDNSPCNLASLNLLKFLRDDGTFDTEAFEHTVFVVLLAQAILCVAADYPTEKIGQNALGFRQLGIGYANLGATLMALGVPYDSALGRAWAAAITSLMQAAAYQASAQFASVVGAYPGTDELPGFSHLENREATLRVLAKHAAFSRSIAFEPITAERGLDPRVDRFHTEVVGHGQPVKNDTYLGLVVARANSVWDEAMSQAEQHGVENSQVSVIAPTGTIAFMMDCDTTGVEPDLALKKHKKMVGGGNMQIVNQTIPRALHRLGYNPESIEAILEFVDEHNSVVGAPALRPEHYPVFACSFTLDNLVSSEGHVLMMAAVQPFISGAISKTINMPEEATVDEVEQVYYDGWRLGLKAVAIYRDNCKADQPLSAQKTEATPAIGAALHPVRRRLPKERPSNTCSFALGDVEGYVHIGKYPDDYEVEELRGAPGEIFIDVAKDGSTLAGIMRAFAISVSMGLQHGVPLKTYVEKFINMKFEPNGITTDADIRIASSLMDFIFRKIALRFLPVPDREELGVRSIQERKVIVDNGELAGRIEVRAPAAVNPNLKAGNLCPRCHNNSLVPDGAGCEYCTNCGFKDGGCGP